jgi:hypothetical protein
MIRIAIVMLVLLMGCGSLKSEFPRYYYGMEGKNFHKDYPNLKLLGHDIQILVLLVGCAMPPEPEPEGGPTYLMPDGRIMKVHPKRGIIWKVTVRQPMPKELDYYREVGIIE